MNDKGISKTDISLVVLYENSYSIILAAIISTLGMYLFSPNDLYSTLALLLFFGSLSTIPIAVFFRKRSFILSAGAYVKLTAICVGFWTLAATAFYSYMNAIGLVTTADSALLTIIHYLFSFVVGFVSIFAPQGIGVFEVVYAELSSNDIPRTQMIIFVAGFRVLVMLSDILIWLGYILTRVIIGVGEKRTAE